MPGHVSSRGSMLSGTLTGNTVTVEGIYDRWAGCKFEGLVSPDGHTTAGYYDCGQSFSWQLTKVKTTVEGITLRPVFPNYLHPREVP